MTAPGAKAELAFDYRTFTGRNRGLVDAEEQRRLEAGRVFVCGVGGMGGAAAESIVRAGMGGVALADHDRFEVSNLNRQLVATGETLGELKTDATARRLTSINPELDVRTYGDDWSAHLDEILTAYPVVVNGMDDPRATLLLYRQARARGVTVIDAYTSPLPSVFVVGPTDPTPEERLGFPTVGRPLEGVTARELDACRFLEIEYVLANSSSADRVDMALAADVLAGRRPRMSFAPAVITAGTLMGLEAINLVIGGRSDTDCRGYFFNPWTGTVERPRGPLSGWIARRRVRRVLAALMAPETEVDHG